MTKDKPTKSRVIEIPNDFNRKLRMRVLELADIGIDTTVPELIIKLAQLGLQIEKKEIEITKI
jgi:hypothetical protein